MIKLKKRLKKMWMDSTIFVDPAPLPPGFKVWEVNVDGKIIYIVSSNRWFAYFWAKCKYPKAKNIQVVKPLNHV